MQKTQQFSCLFRHYAKHNGLNKEDLVFYFTDELLPEGTPESVHLLQNDEILVGLRRSPVESEQKTQLSCSSSPVHRDQEGSFDDFINNSNLSDIKFKFPGDGDASYPVYGHKVVLAARCAYFKMMFSRGYSEASNDILIIDDVSRETFLCLLEYIYTSSVKLLHAFPLHMIPQLNSSTEPSHVPRVEAIDSHHSVASEDCSCNEISEVQTADSPALSLDVEPVIDLMICANKYLLPELQAKCEEVLYFYRKQILTVGNICDYSQLCDRYSASHLRQACQLFIVDHLDLIRQDDQLRKKMSESPEMALLLMDAISASAGTGKRLYSGDVTPSCSKTPRISLSGTVGSNARDDDSNDSLNSSI